MGKQIKFTFYSFTPSNSAFRDVSGHSGVPGCTGVPGCSGVPVFLCSVVFRDVPVFQCSGVPGCAGVPGFSTCRNIVGLERVLRR